MILPIKHSLNSAWSCWFSLAPTHGDFSSLQDPYKYYLGSVCEENIWSNQRCYTILFFRRYVAVLVQTICTVDIDLISIHSYLTKCAVVLAGLMAHLIIVFNVSMKY